MAGAYIGGQARAGVELAHVMSDLKIDLENGAPTHVTVNGIDVLCMVREIRTQMPVHQEVEFEQDSYIRRMRGVAQPMSFTVTFDVIQQLPPAEAQKLAAAITRAIDVE